MQAVCRPRFQKHRAEWEYEAWSQGLVVLWGNWDISDQNHLSVNSPILPALPHTPFLRQSLANLVFWGQIEMPECMEINHRIIQTAAYHLPYIWHNYPTSNMKMLYCNNSQPEEKALLLITWKERRIPNRALQKLLINFSPFEHNWCQFRLQCFHRAWPHSKEI